MPIITTNAELKERKEKKVLKHLDEAQTLLDFLVAISNEERIRMQKIKRTPTAFIQRTKLHMETSPEFVPKIFEFEDFQRITDLLDGLRRIDVELDSFHKKIKDTITVAESDAYTLSRLYYNSTKDAARNGVEHAELILKDLAPFFKPGKPRKKKEAEHLGKALPDTAIPSTKKHNE